ncbi:cobalt ECF transporter T component CbiQ [Rhodobacter sp. NSM]|uniref:cobalt ECF transporter T component CbiQ n=1 Tax=Rhodobacter sp. NSM TaxID=3457501 RepID=UPI003FD3F55E
MSHLLPADVSEPLPDGGALRRIDPRARLVAAAGFALAAVALSTLTGLVLALGLALALLVASRLPVAPTLKRMAMMDGFIVFMLALLPFTVPGTAAFTLWGFPASWQGLRQAVAIALTANAVILALMVLAGTLEPAILGHALARLGVPERLVHLLLFTVRYIEVLAEEYQRLRLAMRARGFRPRTDRHTVTSLGHLVGMMLVRALERSERVLAAMRCRGFTGRLPLIDRLAWRPSDTAFLVGLAMVLLALLLLDLRLAD